jgi:hypothetical protein
MKRIDDCLQRLLDAAARAPGEPVPETPFHLEAAVLAEWRMAQVCDHAALVLPLLRRAFLCACAIVLISGAFSLRHLAEGSPNELVIVDSVFQLTLMQ